MTQEELLRRMEALVSDEVGRQKEAVAFRDEVREAFADLREELTEIKAEIKGAGGIVGKTLCEARERALIATMMERKDATDARFLQVERRQDGLARNLWVLFVATLGALIAGVLKWIKP